MRSKVLIPVTLLVSVVVLGSAGCNLQTIRGTPAQIDQVITRIDLIDQQVALLATNVVQGFFVFGLLLPFILPWILARTDWDYKTVGWRCLVAGLAPAVVVLIVAITVAVWPRTWKLIGVDPLYVKVVHATTNTAQKPVLSADQTQNVLAMRRQAHGYLFARRGAFVLENPVLLIVSVTCASILGALLAYLIYLVLPNGYFAARRHMKMIRSRA